MRPRPPLHLADVDPRSYACSVSPYRLLVMAHAPRTIEDRTICGHCRLDWEELRRRIFTTLLMERAAPPHPHP